MSIQEKMSMSSHALKEKHELEIESLQRTLADEQAARAEADEARQHAQETAAVVEKDMAAGFEEKFKVMQQQVVEETAARKEAETKLVDVESGHALTLQSLEELQQVLVQEQQTRNDIQEKMNMSSHALKEKHE